MYLEFGALQAELGGQTRRSGKFLVDYQDRIVFGTDSGVEEAMYANYFRWLETGDEYFPYWGPRPGAVGDLWNGAAGWDARKGLP